MIYFYLLGDKKFLVFAKRIAVQLACKIKSRPFFLGQRLDIKIYATTSEFPLMPVYVNLIH